MMTVFAWLPKFKKSYGSLLKSRTAALRKALGKRMLSKCCYLIAAVVAVLPVGAEAGTYYSITAEPESGALIQNRTLCSSTIGRGGNLLEAGQKYPGKCEGGGKAPQIVGTQSYLKHLWFRNDPSYSGTLKTRTELAFTQQYFPFDEQVFLGFRMMIPRGTDITVGSAFYLLQLWQCSGAPPIGGIRLSA